MPAQVILALLQAVGQALVMTTLARGTDSAIDQPREVAVRTAEEWQTLWRGHSAGPLPAVDFTQSLVIAVFAGSRPTAGFQVQITGVTVEDDRAVVQYAEQGPAPGDLVAQMLTAPFHVIAVPRTDRRVEFRRLAGP